MCTVDGDCPTGALCRICFLFGRGCISFHSLPENGMNSDIKNVAVSVFLFIFASGKNRLGKYDKRRKGAILHTFMNISGCPNSADYMCK